MAVRDVASMADLDDALAKAPAAAIAFVAPWSEPSMAMAPVYGALAADHPDAAFLRVQAEDDALAPAVERFGVTVVPYFVFLTSGGKVTRAVEGADAPALADAAASLLPAASKGAAGGDAGAGGAPAPSTGGGAAAGGEPAAEAGGDLTARLKALTTQAPVMLFMKGTPDAPRCGFSRRVAGALDDAGVPFGSFDILTDDAVRQGLKEYSDWPTYPQLYVKGELLGGCDIVEELAGAGELKASVDEMLARLD